MFSQFSENVYALFSSPPFDWLVWFIFGSFAALTLAAIVLEWLVPSLRRYPKTPYLCLVNAYTAVTFCAFLTVGDLAPSAAVAALFWAAGYILYGFLCFAFREKNKKPARAPVASATQPVRSFGNAPLGNVRTGVAERQEATDRQITAAQPAAVQPVSAQPVVTVQPVATVQPNISVQPMVQPAVQPLSGFSGEEGKPPTAAADAAKRKGAQVKSGVRLEHAIKVTEKLLGMDLGNSDRQELEKLKNTLEVLRIKGVLTPAESEILNESFNMLLKLMAKYEV